MGAVYGSQTEEYSRKGLTSVRYCRHYNLGLMFLGQGWRFLFLAWDHFADDMMCPYRVVKYVLEMSTPRYSNGTQVSGLADFVTKHVVNELLIPRVTDPYKKAFLDVEIYANLPIALPFGKGTVYISITFWR